MSKDVEQAKDLQDTLLQKLNIKKASLIDPGFGSNIEEMREKFGDILKFEDLDSKNQLSVHEQMRKFLKDIKTDNDTRYWDKLIKFNQGNHAFRESFRSFIHESDNAYHSRMA